MTDTGPGEPGTLTIQNPTIRRGFTALPNAVMDLPNISRDAKYLYAVLLRHAWKDGRCYPGYAVLQTEMGCGIRQVGQYLRELEIALLLQRTRRGRGLTTFYTLLDPPNAGNGRSRPSETEDQDLPKRNAKEDSFEKDSLTSPYGEGASDKPTTPKQEKHPACQTYRQLTRGTLNPARRAVIENAIPSDIDSDGLVRWGNAVTAWVGRGYRKENVVGMLEWWRDGIPSRTNTNGHAPDRPKRVYAGPSAVASYFEKRDGLNGQGTAPGGGGLGDDLVITRISGQLPR